MEMFSLSLLFIAQNYHIFNGVLQMFFVETVMHFSGFFYISNSKINKLMLH